MKIEIKCKTDDYLPFREIADFQGSLKKRTKADIQNIKDKIIEVGFSFPFFIWKSDKNYCLDGHGRLQALYELQNEGWELPESFPIVYIYAKNRAEAVKKALQVLSTYGRITNEGLAEFTEGMEIDLTNLTFTDSYIDFSANVFTQAGDLSPFQNQMKTASFREYGMPVSDRDIEQFHKRLKTYVDQTGTKDGFMMQYLGPFIPAETEDPEGMEEYGEPAEDDAELVSNEGVENDEIDEEIEEVIGENSEENPENKTEKQLEIY